jgi:small-conductance mechanosensitive channel
MPQLLENITRWMSEVLQAVSGAVSSAEFYVQLAAIGIAVALAVTLSYLARKGIRPFRSPPQDGPWLNARFVLYRLRVLVRPLMVITLLGVAVLVAEAQASQTWLVRAAQGLAVIGLLAAIITQFIANRLARTLVLWIGIPIATLRVFGWLDNVTIYLDDVALTVGNIHISLLALLRTLIFGALLFWLGRVSNSAGKQVIRNQPALTVATRELVSKLFEFSLFLVIALLLLQVMGIDLTALAVFGGAVGIGLGFGLQQIAANFISGVIILFDRSVTIGDHIELEDGRAGTLRELNVRYGVLETFDGKDIMVPNERFISSSYTNWTHKDPKQRYSLNFQVAYSTDLDLLFDNIRTICAKHSKVISGDDIPIEMRPDAEIKGFGESGIDILVEFWMEGIDDGKNRVGADLLHSIWRSIQKHGMQIPFPQREVRILHDDVSAR